MVNRNIKFTVKDYMSIQDDKRYELIEGELVVVPSPSLDHQRMVTRLWASLSEFVGERRLGEVLVAPLDIVLSDYDVLQPDVMFVSTERAYIKAPNSIRGAPDLVIEILSPSTEQRDRTTKRNIYARYGVQEFWLVSLEEHSVEVLALGEEGYKTHGVYRTEEAISSPLLEGLSLPVKALFLPT